MSVTEARGIENVEHIGGPYDGYLMPIQVGDDGTPPEFYTINDFAPIDPSIDPGSGPISNLSTQFYERDMRVSDAGAVRWVFVWQAQTVYPPHDAAA